MAIATQQNESAMLPPPVDGLKSWSVSLGSFLIGFTSMGLLYSQGIFVEPLLAEFGESLSATSLVVTMPTAMFYFSGLYSAPVAAKYGIKRFTLIGAIVWVAGCLLGSISPNITASIFTQGVMTGWGTGNMYWVSLAVMPAWFQKYRATGLGLAVLGSGIGSIAFSIGGEELIQAFGWRRTLQIFGGAGGALLLVAVLLLDQRVPPRKSAGLFDMSKKLVHIYSYQLFAVCFFFFQMAFFIPYTFLPHYATTLGLDPAFAAFTLAQLGIGSSVGRIIFSPIADIFKLHLVVFKSTILFAAICLWLWPLCTDEASILAFCFLYGNFGGAFFAMFGVVAAELWGPSNIAATFPLINIASIPGAFGSAPLFASIVQSTGTFTYAMFYAASMLTLSFVSMLFIRFDAAILQSLNDHNTAVVAPTPLSSSV